MRRVSVLIILLISTVLTCSGCFALLIGAAAGAGGISYAKGAYEKSFDKPLEKIYRASVKALNKNNMVIAKENVGKHETTVEFSTNDGKSGKIIITALTEHAAKINIRIGVFGDEALSRIILNSIEANL